MISITLKGNRIVVTADEGELDCFRRVVKSINRRYPERCDIEHHHDGGVVATFDVSPGARACLALERECGWADAWYRHWVRTDCRVLDRVIEEAELFGVDLGALFTSFRSLAGNPVEQAFIQYLDEDVVEQFFPPEYWD